MRSTPDPLPGRLDRAKILVWPREDSPARLESLWAAGDEARRRHVGDEVHLRAEMCRGCP